MNTQDKLNEIISLAAKVKEELGGQLNLEGKLYVEIGTARMIVAKVLDQIPESRNNPNLFYSAVEKIYKECGIPHDKTTQETWRRTAQYYQNTLGWWEPSKEVKETRMAKAKIWSGMWKKPL